MIGVYGILCLKNGQMYIGQSRNIEKRWSNHQYKLRRNEHYAERLQKAWNRYGKDMFRLIIIEETEEARAYERELWWIKTLMTYKPGKGFNRDGKKKWRTKNKSNSAKE